MSSYCIFRKFCWLDWFSLHKACVIGFALQPVCKRRIMKRSTDCRAKAEKLKVSIFQFLWSDTFFCKRSTCGFSNNMYSCLHSEYFLYYILLNWVYFLLMSLFQFTNKKSLRRADVANRHLLWHLQWTAVDSLFYVYLFQIKDA